MSKKQQRNMAYKRRAKKKEDLSKNPEQGVDTSMGRYYLEMGMVKIIDRQNKAIKIKHYESN